jgi:BirA family transcriptional regulator, biotin operon repressor / biotin---[acetyl-CoA-carboxylase] ligase
MNDILKYVPPALQRTLDELVLLDTVDSTNDYLLKLAHTGKTIACFAEQQTAAKGQRGKRWVSPPGGQIYFSLLSELQRQPSEIIGLSLAMGIAVVRTLRCYGVDADLKVKWPNDIYHNHKKLVGILVETAPGVSGHCAVVIGIGINLDVPPEQAAAISQPWTCLRQILNRPIARDQLSGILLRETLLAVTEFAEQGLTPFQAEWQAVDYLRGQRVTVSSPHQILIGLMQGISTHGELRLLDDQGQNHLCLNGTVRLVEPLIPYFAVL